MPLLSRAYPSWQLAGLQGITKRSARCSCAGAEGEGTTTTSSGSGGATSESFTSKAQAAPAAAATGRATNETTTTRRKRRRGKHKLPSVVLRVAGSEGCCAFGHGHIKREMQMQR